MGHFLHIIQVVSTLKVTDLNLKTGIFTTMVKHKIVAICVLLTICCVFAKDLDLNNENEFFTAKWIDPPVSPTLKIYVFNFVNSDEFLKDSSVKPKLEELGPYVFKETWAKEDIEWKNDDNIIEYDQLRYFKFLPNLSEGKLRDEVTVPNIPMIAALDATKDGSDLIKRSIGGVLDVLEQTPFEKLTVRKLLFGYATPLLKLGSDILPPEKRWPHQLFGLFVGQNATSRGRLTVKTAVNNRGDLAQITKFNGKSELPWWSGECNKFEGSTDGFVFRPNLEKTDIIRVFNRDLCRSIPLKFSEEFTDPNGIPGYRFVPPSDVFASPDINKANACFCDNPNGVCDTPSGAFDVSKCQFGSPVMLSWPHFFQADPKLVDAIDGLNPDRSKHQFSIDVQPVTGSGLGGKVRSQINIKMSKVDEDLVKTAKGLRDLLLPVVWFSDDIDKVTDQELVDKIKSSL